jgi:hypothetical protein
MSRGSGVLPSSSHICPYRNNIFESETLKRPLGRLRCRWEDNIESDLREIRYGIDWTHLAQDRD